MTAARTALHDQLGAAVRDAQHVVDTTAAILPGATRADTTPGPYATVLLEAMGRRVATQKQGTCRHLRRGPGVAWLLAWATERVRCAECAAVVIRRSVGTPEDQTCDVCRRPARLLHTVLGAAGPVVLVFGACGPCFELETAGVEQ